MKIALTIIICVVIAAAIVGGVLALNDIAEQAQADRIEYALTKGMFKR
jgi:type III secretory pathway component EscS